MRRYEEKKTTSTYTSCVSLTCDICGAAAPTPSASWSGRAWVDAGSYDILDVKVRLKDGASYPEGGHGERVGFDICPECFRSKLVPLIESTFKIKATKSEWETW